MNREKLFQKRLLWYPDFYTICLLLFECCREVASAWKPCNANIQYCVRCDATKTLNVSLLSSSLLTASSWSVINDRYFIYLFMPSNRLFVCICHKQPNGEVVLFFTCICFYVLKPLKEILFDSTSLGCLFQVPSRIYFLFFAKLAPYHCLSISG